MQIIKKRNILPLLPKLFTGMQRPCFCYVKYDKVKDERIDLFLAAYWKESPYKKLCELVKCLLVLSHGQAGVERGVSVNNEIMAKILAEFLTSRLTKNLEML